MWIHNIAHVVMKLCLGYRLPVKKAIQIYISWDKVQRLSSPEHSLQISQELADGGVLRREGRVQPTSDGIQSYWVLPKIIVVPG